MTTPFSAPAGPSELTPSTPRLSVVMSTFNRGELLDGAIRSVLAQDPGRTPPFELIVVDNNSTDGTRTIVDRFIRVDGRVRYLFEPRQGLSHARNAGIAAARAALVAFTDDDVRAEPDWVAAVVRAFDEYPGADAAGGRVLPIWPAEPPGWLTPDHWAPLALADHGAAPVTIGPERPICLVGANLAVRHEVFDAIGGFATELQRVKDGIGSLEDHEFMLRLLGAGRTAVYDPRIVIHAEIQPNRLERTYHRRWHRGHGHFHALLRSEHMERTRLGRLLGVPAHLYRQALGDLGGYGWARVKRDTAAAFHHEVRLRFFGGFFATRSREFFRKPAGHGRPDEQPRRAHALRREPRPSADAGIVQGRG